MSFLLLCSGLNVMLVNYFEFYTILYTVSDRDDLLDKATKRCVLAFCITFKYFICDKCLPFEILHFSAQRRDLRAYFATIYDVFYYEAHFVDVHLYYAYTSIVACRLPLAFFADPIDFYV